MNPTYEMCVLCIVLILSPRKNGTMSTCPPFSTPEPPLLPPATELPVRVSAPTDSISLALTQLTAQDIIADFSTINLVFIEIAADSLKGRVFEISLADLNKEAKE